VLIYSMTVSVDGFINDRVGDFSWGAPSDELFEFHLDRVRGLGAYLCGRKLYETMLPWETHPAMRSTALMTEFADIWCALPKIVFSNTLTTVEGNARLAQSSLANELAAVKNATDKDAEIGGATLAAEAIRTGLVDEFRIFRIPIIVGGGTPLLPPITESVPLELLETRAFDSRVIYERYRCGSS
jgi:dihydrofolate reductase